MPAKIDVVGHRYGRLLVIADAEPSATGAKRALVECDCGVRKTVLVASMRSGTTFSCGCILKDRNEVIGKVFGKLTVIELSHKDENRRSFWKCRCDCGREAILRKDQITGARTQSCGCLNRGIVSNILRSHGMEMGRKNREPEYIIWRAMISRCFNQNSKSYADYGGRGITVCEDWLIFENFYRDMGSRPSKNHSVDRVNNDLGYSKENCRWATKVEQATNKRNTVWIEMVDGLMPLSLASRKYGIPRETIRKRALRGVDKSELHLPRVTTRRAS